MRRRQPPASPAPSASGRLIGGQLGGLIVALGRAVLLRRGSLLQASVRQPAASRPHTGRAASLQAPALQTEQHQWGGGTAAGPTTTERPRALWRGHCQRGRRRWGGVHVLPAGPDEGQARDEHGDPEGHGHLWAALMLHITSTRGCCAITACAQGAGKRPCETPLLWVSSHAQGEVVRGLLLKALQTGQCSCFHHPTPQQL